MKTGLNGHTNITNELFQQSAMLSVKEGVEEWLQLVSHAVDNIHPVLEHKDMNDFVQPIVQRWNMAVFLQKRLWQVWTQAPWTKAQEIPFDNFWVKKPTDSMLTVVLDEWRKEKQKKILRWLHKRAGRQHVLVIFGFEWENTTTSGPGGHWTLMYFDTVNHVQSFYDPQGHANLAAAVESHGILSGYKWKVFGPMHGMQDILFEGPSNLIMHGFCGMTVLLMLQCCYRLQYYNLEHVESAIIDCLMRRFRELIRRQEFLIRWIWNIAYVNSWGGLLASLGLFQKIGLTGRDQKPPHHQKCYAAISQDGILCGQPPVYPEVYCETHRHCIRPSDCATNLSLSECFDQRHALFVHPNTVNKPPHISLHVHQLALCMHNHFDSVIVKRKWPERWAGLNLGDMHEEMGCTIQKNALLVELQDDEYTTSLTDLCQMQLDDSVDVFGVVVLVTHVGSLLRAMHYQWFARRTSQHAQVRMLFMDNQLVVYDGPRRQSNALLNDMIHHELVSLTGLVHVRLSDSGDSKLLKSIAHSPSMIASFHVNVEDQTESLDALKTLMLHALHIAEDCHTLPSHVFDNSTVATVCSGPAEPPHRIEVTTTMRTCKRVGLRLGNSPMCFQICDHLHMNLPTNLQMYELKVVGNPASWFDNIMSVTSHIAIMKIAFENVGPLDWFGWHQVIGSFTKLRKETRELHLCLRSQPPLAASENASIPKVIIDALEAHEKYWITELHVSLDGLPVRSLPAPSLPPRDPPVFPHLHHIELHCVRGDIDDFDNISDIVHDLQQCCPCLEYLQISTEYQPPPAATENIEHLLAQITTFVLVLVLGQLTFTS